MFLCTGLSPEVQLVIIGLYGEIRETRVYISPQVPGLPQRAALDPSHARSSLTQSIHLLSYLDSSKTNI